MVWRLKKFSSDELQADESLENIEDSMDPEIYRDTSTF